MSAEDSSYTSGHNVCVLEKIWTKLLMTWVNNCVAPKRSVKALNPEDLSEIIKKYKYDVYEFGKDVDLVTSGRIDAFIARRYPTLKLGDIELKSCAEKKWYLLASVLLYCCCTRSSSGAVDADICRRLGKDEQEMVLTFCELLRHREVTLDNVQGCIREACKPFYEAQRKYELDCCTNNKRSKLVYCSNYSSDDMSSFTSGSTKSVVDKANTIPYSESFDMPDAPLDQIQGSIANKSGDHDKKQILKTGFSDSIQSENVEASMPPQKRKDGFDNTSKCFVSSAVCQRSVKSFKPPRKYLSDVVAKGTRTSGKHQSARTIQPFQSSDAAKIVHPTSPGGKNDPERNLNQVMIPDKETLKVKAPSSRILARIRRSQSKSLETRSVLKEQVESPQNSQREKIMYPSEHTRVYTKSSECVSRKRPDTRNHSCQSVKKPKYDGKVTPTFLEKNFTSAAFSRVSVDSSSKSALLAAPEPGPSVTWVADVPKVKIVDELTSWCDDAQEELHRIIENRDERAKPVPEDLTKKFCSDCQGCLAPSRVCEEPKKKKIFLHFFRFMGRFPRFNSKVVESEETKDRNSIIIEKEEQKDPEQMQLERTPSRGSQRPWWSKQIFLDHQVLFVSCLLGWLMVGFVTLIALYYRPDPAVKRALQERRAPAVDRVVRSDYEGNGNNVPVPISSSHYAWTCRQNICVKQSKVDVKYHRDIFLSLSRCTLLCTGPQLWPQPIGDTNYSKSIIALSIDNLKYKFKKIPSDRVTMYASKAFKLFLHDLTLLERREHKKKRGATDLPLNRLVIHMSISSDQDPNLRLDTDETYNLKLASTKDSVTMADISADSFSGFRHALETLSQLLLLDEKTGYLITLDSCSVKDGPSHRYRGLMIDTARNYFPVVDLVRTIDAMAMCKLNTLHWRISDATSFPLFLDSVPNLAEFGAYDNGMIYDRKDVEEVVERAKVRGIRVVIEVAAPGPVGRAWMWTSNSHCQKKSNDTCDILCRRLEMGTMTFDILEKIYREIISLTNVRDVFHLSNGIFSLTNCPNLLEDRDGFLEKALYRLKLANRGFIPKLPIVWLTPQLFKKYDAEVWSKYGIQLYDLGDIQQSEKLLSRFKLIYSAKWDLSCQMKRMRCHKYKTWQEMYKWNTWKTLNVFTLEGGEATLWTDLVSPSGLDDVLWPRAAAVAERLWSDIVLEARIQPSVYLRLDTHRWRMLLRGPVVPEN